MPEEETPRQILFALCWRGEEGALDKVGLLLLFTILSTRVADIGGGRGVSRVTTRANQVRRLITPDSVSRRYMCKGSVFFP